MKTKARKRPSKGEFEAQRNLMLHLRASAGLAVGLTREQAHAMPLVELMTKIGNFHQRHVDIRKALEAIAARIGFGAGVEVPDRLSKLVIERVDVTSAREKIISHTAKALELDDALIPHHGNALEERAKTVMGNLKGAREEREFHRRRADRSAAELRAYEAGFQRALEIIELSGNQPLASMVRDWCHKQARENVRAATICADEKSEPSATRTQAGA